MKNIRLTIQYDGTRYKGWQRQREKNDNITTIQGKIENVLTKMLGEEIELIGCSRTDAGVHVENYIANFFTKSEYSFEEMKKYLLDYLPEDIVIKNIKLAGDRFHSRYNVKSKTYVYRIDNKDYMDVFNKRFSYYLKDKLDVVSMKKASNYLIGTHNFKSFTNLKANTKKSTIRTINFINIIENNGIIEIEINGDGFLLNMVRIIVGTLIEVGNKKINPEDIKDILEKENREFAGDKVPAKGLILKEIFY